MVARHPSAYGLGVIGITIAVAAGACSAASKGETFGAGGGASNGTGAGSTGAGAGSSGVGGDNLITTTGSGGSGSGVGGGCAGTSVKAEKLPLDMYIMLDQSGSMTDPVSGGGDKWGAVTSALTAFVQQPQAVGLGVGLQYFGLAAGGMACPSTCFTDADCGACGPCIAPIPSFPGICFGSGGGDSCNAADYAKPEVEIAPLPGVANAIIASMGMHSPTTSTPTSAALQGAVDHAKAWATMNPTHVVIAVLATDGDPTECDTNLANIDGIAATAANGMPKISTFVIGVGSSLSALNGIAAAGGTGQAFIVDTNQNATQQFLDALNKIQGTALGCTYSIPTPDAGMADYSSVNVKYTPGDGMPPETFPKVDDKAHCPASGNAWYYDDNAAPTKIIMCDATCSAISADTKGQVDIVLGCQTIIK